MDMSLAQYVEAKVLQNDSLHLEKNIQHQQFDIEKLNEEIERLKMTNAELEQQLTNSKLNQIPTQVSKSSISKKDHLKLFFSHENEKNSFLAMLKKLSEKYQIEDLQLVLKKCLEYTYWNETSKYFLKTVKDFFSKKRSNKFYKSSKTISK